MEREDKPFDGIRGFIMNLNRTNLVVVNEDAPSNDTFLDTLLFYFNEDQNSHFSLVICFTDLLTTALFEDKKKHIFVLTAEKE